MRVPSFIFVMVMIFMICSVEPAQAKDAVINDCFEMMNLDYWTWVGSPQHMITLYDVTGSGETSWCHMTVPNSSTNGSLKQQIFVMEGETYTVEADACYYNC